jgi:hypothetical protein
MATLLLGAVGSALGGVFGSLGAVIGQAAGAIAGSLVDRAIVNALTPPVRHEGPRLTTTDMQASTEGSVVDRVSGRARVTGQVIWATRFEEEVTTEKSGGKGGGPKVVTTTYSYFGNFAIGLCEGPIAGIGRIWADGKEIDQQLFELRVYRGDEAQVPDPLIEAKEGSAPAYRGLAYVVFERMPLEEYGNRLPQMSVEVFDPPGDLEGLIEGVAIIGGNEFGYDPTLVKTSREQGGEEVNRHTLVAPTDWTAAIDRLEMLAPNIKSVMLIVPWFGDDLRCGACTVRPKVDNPDKSTKPYQWRVGSLTRAGAQVTTQLDGSPAYGGTPADASVIRAIHDLNARGIAVTLNPFLMMDIAPGNALPNPYSNNASVNGQPPFPWRGRITCSPAAGFAGSVDKTATAAAQVGAFMGTAAPDDFGGSGTTVTYAGPSEWSYRRFVLHVAKLGALAGGVEALLIGSEMIGLSQVRSSAAAYPFVTALKTLAADVSGMLGNGVKVGYAADWSEYNSHRPADGSGDLYFHLDPLWSDANIDFVGIDNYFPLADWRDGSTHLDFDPAGGPTTIYDAAYLGSQVEGGEGYDWFYASRADRDAQVRSPITDGAYGKPWVYRQKDVRGWWSNSHRNRPGGVESGAPTAWVAQSKPVRFIEMGCPAVDKGANQPNVFVDPKSSESFFPYYSSQARDDAVQRVYLEAMIGHYAKPANNPVSAVYGARMLDLQHSFVWCWDARPWPSFDLDNSWGDAPNWQQGHWLTGRLGTAPARETIRAILDRAGFADYAVEPIPAVVDGLTSGVLGSARATLDALRPVYQFDAVESGGVIRFLSRLGRAPVASVAGDELVAGGEVPRFRLTRAQETELPQAIKLRYGDPARDDQPAGTEARRIAGGSLRTLEYSVPAIMPENVARAICEQELHSAWTGRERAAFALPPSFLALDPGDVIDFAPTGRMLRIAEATDGLARSLEAYRVEPLALAPVRMPRSGGKKAAATLFLDAQAVFIDGPLLEDDDPDHAGYVGGVVLPFRSGLAVHRAPGTSGYTLDTVLSVPATLGVTTADFHSGVVGRWDRRQSLAVRLVRGSLSSADELLVLNGANPLLVQNGDGEWELLQYATATPTGARAYTLTNLLRGQRGTEHAMREPVAAGAPVIVPNVAIRSTAITPALVGLPLNWRIGPADRDIGSADYVDMALTLRGKGRRPLSPVHLRARQEPDGDFGLTWVRRTRIAGDSWEQADVPLGEEFERYDVEILDAVGATVLRTMSGLTAPAWTYPASLQTADFGAPQPSLKWRVYQISATYGRGIPGVHS